MRIKAQPRLIRVDWIDACSEGDWRSPERFESIESIPIRTVGYVVRSTEKEMVLAQSLSDSGRVSNTLAIPRGCICKVRRLRSKP